MHVWARAPAIKHHSLPGLNRCTCISHKIMKKVYKVHIIFPKNLVVLHHDWKNDNKNGVSSVFNNNK